MRETTLRSLVSKCLLQGAGRDQYRMHDLVVEFAKMKIMTDREMARRTSALQAQYLRRLDVVKGYDSEQGAREQGFFLLDALWVLGGRARGRP